MNAADETVVSGSRESSQGSHMKRKSMMSSFKDLLIGNLVDDLRKKHKKRKRRMTSNSSRID